MPMPWDFVRSTRVEGGPNPDSSEIVREIGMAGRSIASAKAAKGEALGAGIAGGLTALGTGIRRSRERAEDRQFQIEDREDQQAFQAGEAQKARDQDPYTKFRLEELAQKRATDNLFRHVEYTTPEKYLSQPAGGGPPNAIPRPEAISENLWNAFSGKPNSYAGLPEPVKRRLAEHVAIAGGRQIPFLRPGPELDKALAEADPQTAARLREEAYTPETILPRLTSELRESFYKDPLVQQALLQQDLEDQPAIQAESRGALPLAGVLRETKGRPEVGAAAEALWSAFESGARVGTGAGTMSIGSFAAQYPDLTPEQIELMKGRMTVRVPSFMIDKDGNAITNVTGLRSWMRTQEDKLPFLQSIANREPYEIARAAFLVDQGRSFLSGMKKGGKWALEMSDPKRAAWVQANLDKLKADYGETAIGGLLAAKFMGLQATPEQILGDQAGQAEDITKAVDEIYAAMRSDIGTRVGGVAVANDAAVSELVDAEWESSLGQATMERAGPLSQFANIPTPTLAEAWRRLGAKVAEDPSWQTMDAAMKDVTIPEPLRRQAMPKLWSSFIGNRDFVISNFAQIDAKGREFAHLPEAEKRAVLDDLARKVVGTHLKAAPKGVTSSMRDTLPGKMQPPLRTPGSVESQFKGHVATVGAPTTPTVEIIDEKTKERHILKDGVYQHTEDLETGKKKSEPGKSLWGQTKAQAWVPAQDAFRWKMQKLGYTDHTEFVRQWRPQNTVSPLVDAVMGHQVQGHPLYRHMIEALAAGEGRDLTTAYDAALTTMTKIAADLGQTLGDVFREFDYAASQQPDDPVLLGVSIMLGESLSPNKAGYGDRQMSRVIDMPGAKAMRPGFMASVPGAGGQFLGPVQQTKMPQEFPTEERRRREALFSFPWSKGLSTDQRVQSATSMATLGIPAMMEVAGEAMVEARGKKPRHYEEKRNAAIARIQKAVEQGKGYLAPVMEKTESGWQPSGTEWVNPGDPEYGMIPLPLQHWEQFQAWSEAREKKERAARNRPVRELGGAVGAFMEGAGR